MTQWFDDVLRIPTLCVDYINPIRENWPVLLEAASSGDVDAVRLLLAHGADPRALVMGKPLIEVLADNRKQFRKYPQAPGTDAAIGQCISLISAATSN